MKKHQQRVQAVYRFIEQNDLDLGFRKLLDCAMDTQNMSIYESAIALTDFKENHPEAQEVLKQKMKDLLSEIDQIDVAETPINLPVMEVFEISKSYGWGKFSLGPVSMSIRKGQVYGLVGENGNGKTTLLRIMAGELSYMQGHIKYSFADPGLSRYDLRTKLVYIPQRTDRWFGSLKDNLKFVLSSYKVSADEIQTRVYMMIARMGLWKYRNMQWNELSSGYKMRFELARTLLRKPEILFLDEPLANLDVLAQQIILEDLKSIANSVRHPIALILSSQQLYEVEKNSDQVIFLKNGTYKENYKHAENQSQELIVEIDTAVTREELLQIFDTLHLVKVQYNGGLYVIYFEKQINFPQVLEMVGASKIPVTYIRNITDSTRRFFVQ